MIIGITGKIASGKSSVAKIFHEKGYQLFDADAEYHKLLINNNNLINELASAFGKDILIDNKISRPKLLKKINQQNKSQLNSITHKYVIAEIKKFVSKNKNTVIEAAIPVEDGFLTLCDKVILTMCTYDVQIERIKKRKKYNDTQMKNLVNLQMKNEQYLQLSDYVIDTTNLNLSELSNMINLLF